MKENSMEKCESYYEMAEEKLRAVAEAAGVPLEFARKLCVETDWLARGDDYLDVIGSSEHQRYIDTAPVKIIAEWLAGVYEERAK